MRILTAAEMAEADRRTSADFNIPITELMENAGEAVAKFILRRYPAPAAGQHVVVLCGKGNNGGDGLVAARRLWVAGRQATVLLLAKEEDLTGDVLTALHRLHAEAAGVAIKSITTEAELAERGIAVIEGAQIVVDAVVGTGFKPPLRPLAAAVRDRVAQVTGVVVAIDIPSGWDADSTAQDAVGAFRADAVVTFTAPKTAHIFAQMTEVVGGPIVVAEIGSPEGVVKSEQRLSWTGESKSLADRPRAADSNKGKFGHVLVIGGSAGKAGAPAMASLAALRTGAGLVTAAVPERIVSTIAGFAPELMLRALQEDDVGSASTDNLHELDQLLDRATVAAIGPGLSTEGDASLFARDFVSRTKLPLVVDADALNAFASRAHLLRGEGRTLVLTPHPGEMARLIGKSVADVEADRVNIARTFALQHKLTLVLKGWRTLVAHPDGRVAVNTSGNPAMAKGGSGDILTGIIAAMLAQFPQNPAQAVEAAVFLHGLAADFAAQRIDEHTVLATDTLRHLSDAFRYHVRDADGFIWLTGVRK